MELGYIQSRDGVIWTPKERLLVILSYFDKRSVSLENGADDSSRTVHAYKCGACKKVIIDYSTE